MKITFAITGILCGLFMNAQELTITEEGRYTNGEEGTCEISTYDKDSKKLFTTNAADSVIDIIDITNTSSPNLISSIDISNYGSSVNSIVAVNGSYIAAAVEADNAQDLGSVVFFNLNGDYISDVSVGYMPDMITISPDGQKILVANEGEPNDEYTVDPEGSVSIIDISNGVQNISTAQVSTIEFDNLPNSIDGAIKKPNTSWSEDLEPEYITVSEDSQTAFVVCQESNVLLSINLTTNEISNILGLGFKDYTTGNNKLDASDKDDSINIQHWNVKGVYQPDAIANYTVNGIKYIISANEGDSRDYDGYSSETRIEDLILDPTQFPDASVLQQEENLGRLKTFTTDMLGDTDNDGDVDELYCYGGRSFSIWTENGLVWDSGDDFEQYIATNHPNYFNCNKGKSSKKDKRSDDKGAEAEAIAIGKINNKYFAFIGLERQGGIMVYNITDPTNPSFVTYIESITANGKMTDIAPEGLLFIPADKSHTNENLLIVSNEISGTTTIYKVENNVTLSTEIEGDRTFDIYPNPVKDTLTIDCKNNSLKDLKIIDVSGKSVLKENVTQRKVLNISKLPKGLYFIELIERTSRKKFRRKFIKN